MEKLSVLFVCMGNICRSPAAEGILNNRIKRLHLNNLRCESAAMIDRNEGQTYDERMKEHAKKRGYSLEGFSRPFDSSSDFTDFDYIIAMDDDNYLGLKTRGQGRFDDKIYMMTDFCIDRSDSFVPDPYLGGGQGFENVLNIIEDGVDGLLEHLRQSGKI